MSIEQSLEKLTAAIEAVTGVLVAMQGGASAAITEVKVAAPKVAADAPAEAAPTAGKRGRPAKAAAPAPSSKMNANGHAAASSESDGFALDDDDALGEGDDLGGDDLGGVDEVSADEAKGAILAYRDAAVKIKGKDAGLAQTRAIMKKFVSSLDEVTAANAALIHKTFTAESARLK